MDWFRLFLFLHILAAIVAFGPTFVLPILGSMGGRSPMNAAFALRASEAVEMKLVVPIGLTMPVTGAALIINQHIDLLKTTWLLTAIGFYVVAYGLALFHQVPVTKRLIHMIEGMAPAGAPPAMAAAGPGAAVAGPPPEMATLITRVRLVGVFMHLLLLAIIGLMVYGAGHITYLV